MKKWLFFLLPVLLIVVGVFFYFRSHQIKPANDLGRIPQNEGIEIEERTQNLLKQLNVAPGNTVQLHAVDASVANIFGALRWSSSNGKTMMTVTAALPQPTQGEYQVWIEKSGASPKKLGTMMFEKAGYLLDIEMTQSLKDYTTLIISLEKTNDENIEQKVLEGSIQLP
jgi:hypothetical protein